MGSTPHDPARAPRAGASDLAPRRRPVTTATRTLVAATLFGCGSGVEGVTGRATWSSSKLALLDDEAAARGQLGPVEGGEVGLEDREPLVAVRVQGEARARRLEQGLQAEVAAEEGRLALGDDELVVVDARLGQGRQGVLGARRREVVDALDEDRDRPRDASLLDLGGEPGGERRGGLAADGRLGPDARGRAAPTCAAAS